MPKTPRPIRLPFPSLAITATISSWLLCAIFTAAPARGEDWPQWLGTHRDAVWRETGVVASFPEGGPPVTWRVPVGPGYSGPAVADGRVFLLDRQAQLDEEGNAMAAEDTSLLGSERVLCFDESNGKLLWQHAYDCPYRISYPSGPRTTPLVEGNRVYTLGAMGDMLCLDVADGQVIWSVSLIERFQTKPPVWGYACHPLLDGERLIILAGGENSAVVALNKLNGETVWQSVTAEEVGYATAVLRVAGEDRQLIVWHDVAVKSLNPDTGEVLWSAPFPTEGVPQRPVVPIMTPQIAGNLLLVSNFYNGSLVLQVDWAKRSTQVQWTSDKGDPRHNEGLNVLMATPVIDGDYIYGAAGYGELRCVELRTGKVQWRDVTPLGNRKAPFATCFLIKHEDHFFIFNDQGFLIIAQLTPTGYRELSRAKLLENTSFARGRKVVWSHPAFANRAMFARNDKELIRVNLAIPQPAGGQ